MPSDDDRERLAETFDRAAQLYHRARPDYPTELFDDLVAVAGLSPGDRALEVGCATGKATFPLVRRGLRITCIQLGSNLAAVARQNVAGRDVEVVEARFEDWQPRPGEKFDLTAAVALHFMHYNFARPDKTLSKPYPTTPAIASGKAGRVWTLQEIAGLLD
jgi:SAM-dependent methyltransferase